ncbi:hypothetical protein BVI2075_110152 [Burkholderia vietnamiensis]|nr:hypothetical protein BVI2075_110152 [Burkholderia vietnamiensis]
MLLEVHAFSASFRLREPLPQTLKAVRTLLRGTHRCLRPFERAGPVTRHACRLRGTRGSIAQARAAHNARNRILRFTVSIWYAAQRDRTQRTRAPATHGRPSTAVHARRIIFDIASVFAREPSYNACTALASISPTGM